LFRDDRLALGKRPVVSPKPAAAANRVRAIKSQDRAHFPGKTSGWRIVARALWWISAVP